MSGDLGHPLRVGVTLPPTTSARVLARAAEEGGLDVAAVLAPDDQTGTPEGALDPWTVAGGLAAVTRRITLLVGADPAAGPGSVLGRASASLDLLSAGRLEVALDTTGTPAPAEVTVETAEVVRAMWASGSSEAVRYAGSHHHVDDAQGGPSPAHDVPLWVRLTGADTLTGAARVADGVLLDATLLRSGSLDVDAAVRGADRDPREVRRGVVVPADLDDVDAIAALVTEHGASTVLVAATSEQDVPIVADSLAPALREAIARAHTRAGVSEQLPLRRTDVRSLRRPGIAYDEVPAALAGTAVEPGDARYGAVRSTYARGGSPGLVLHPTDEGQVADAIRFAAAQDAPLGIRSGGHGISGRSTNDGGVIVNLRAFRDIELVDPVRRLVRVGAGARWGEVAQALRPYGWATSSGDSGSVGVGGLATAGGIGFLGREHGLTIDHVEALDVVTADGSLVRASADENAELFWGMRGAGSALGVATSFVLQAQTVGDVGFAQLVFDATDVASFLRGYGEVVSHAPRDLTAFAIVSRQQPGQPRIGFVMAMVDSPDPATVVDRLQPFVGIGRLLQQSVGLTPYSGAVTHEGDAPYQGVGEPVARSGFLGEITDEVAHAAARFVDSGATYFFQLRSVGGAVSDVAPDATAYAHRDALFSLVAFGTTPQAIDPMWDTLIAPHTRGLYWSFSTDRRPQRLLDAYPPTTLARLRRLKRDVDPHNLFRDNVDLWADVPAAGGRAGL